MSNNQLPLGYTSRYAKPEHVGAPYAIGSDASREAAKAISRYADQQRTEVYLCIHRAHDNGRTWDEIVQLLGCSPTANGRVTELRDRGLILDSGRRRKTRSNRNATVWIVPPLETKP